MTKNSQDTRPGGWTSLVLAVVFIVIVAAAAYFILQP
jgi:hypothetical protein